MALARDPAQRYQTARAMSRDLERFLGHWGDSVPHADVADWMATLFPARPIGSRRCCARPSPPARCRRQIQMPVVGPRRRHHEGARGPRRPRADDRPAAQPLAVTVDDRRAVRW